MFLKDLVNKEIVSGKNVKGVCRGVGVSLKSHAVKYLLCASAPSSADADFAVAVSAVENVDKQIYLSQLRPVLPKSCARIFIGRPVYSFEGVHLGNVADLEIQGFIATRLYTDQAIAYPVNGITACFDAVILKRELAYPLGQRIPAPMLSLVTNKADAVVTKPILRTAIRKGALTRLTLSLPPFYLDV